MATLPGVKDCNGERVTMIRLTNLTKAHLSATLDDPSKCDSLALLLTADVLKNYDGMAIAMVLHESRSLYAADPTAFCILTRWYNDGIRQL